MSGARPSQPPPVGPRRPGRDLLGIDGLGANELCEILADAARLVPVVTGPPPRELALLRGYTVVNLFGEPSTRTRSSFTVAAQRLGASVLDFVASAHSSSAKGETIEDAARNLDALEADALVVRHEREGLPGVLAACCRARVVNAGDGRGEHPTQALLDVLTIVEATGRPLDGARTLAGVSVAICGDVENGRVAHSDLLILRALGASVRVAGPPQLLSEDTAARYGFEPLRSLEAAIGGADVVIMLRIQRERLGAELDMSDAEYHAAWGLDAARLARCCPGAHVLHPGPLNRGIEIADDVADGPNSRILRQVTLGVATRMAVLARACDVPLPEELCP